MSLKKIYKKYEVRVRKNSRTFLNSQLNFLLSYQTFKKKSKEIQSKNWAKEDKIQSFGYNLN
jgi:hypothetical protein